jgi:DNA-directed RNA polymerase subunit RPC12/RpoP
MGKKEPWGDDRITHGICPKCKKKVLKEEEEKIYIECPNCHTIIIAEDKKC